MSSEPSAPPLSWVAEFLAHLCDVRGFSAGTVKTYRMTLRDFQKRMGDLEHSTLTTRDLDRYAGRLAMAAMSENTRRSRICALRSYFEFGFTRSFRVDNPARDVHPPRLRQVERIPTFTTGEIERVVFEFRPQAPIRQKREPEVLFSRRRKLYELSTARDTAILAVAYQLGLRASDLSLLERRDYDVENRMPVLTLRGGKWSREPTAFRLDRRVSGALETHLSQLDRAGIRSTALFPPLSHRRAVSGLGIGRNEFAAILTRRMKGAGIEPRGRKLTPHAIRYTIATHLYERGVRPEEIQFLLRHKSVQTTWRYIRLGSAASIQKRTIHALYWNRSGLLNHPVGPAAKTLSREKSEIAKEAPGQAVRQKPSARKSEINPR